MLLSSFSNHQTKLYGRVYAVLTMRHRKAGSTLCAIKKLQENSQMLQVHVTFMGHCNFSNIFYVNVIMCYLRVAISSDKLSFSMHLGCKEPHGIAIMPVAICGASCSNSYEANVYRTGPRLYSF
jgi:hypothetical protein